MTAAEFKKWTEEHAESVADYYANGISYKFAELRDGWTAIFEATGCSYTPLIQASDRAHAESYCYLREPLTVPVQVLFED